MSGLEPFILGLFGAGEAGATAAGAGAAAAGGLSAGQTLGLIGTGVSVAGTIAGRAYRPPTPPAIRRRWRSRTRMRLAPPLSARQRPEGAKVASSSHVSAHSSPEAAAALPIRLSSMLWAIPLRPPILRRGQTFIGASSRRGAIRTPPTWRTGRRGRRWGPSYLGAASDLFSGVSNMYARFGAQQKKTQTASTVMVPYG